MGRTTPRLRTTAGFLALLCLTALLLLLLIRVRESPDRGGRGSSAEAGQDGRVKELEKQLAESRQLVEGRRAELADVRRQIDAIRNHLTFAPAAEVRDEDYAQARAQFRTKLVRKGPSPDQAPPLPVPVGVTEVEYRSGELRLKAWVNRPANEGRKRPAVVFLHGGHSMALDDWEQTRPYRDAGFVVLAPMLRGENGQPGHFTYFYDEVDDVLATADYLSAQPYVDADRLFLAGHSIGGTLTLLSAMASRRFSAAAAFSGAPYWTLFTTARNLPFDKSNPREIQLRSPMVYASSFKCPLRMYYGTEEADFADLMTRRTAALAKSRGLDVEAVEIEGGHGSHYWRAVLRSIAFFQRDLPHESTAAAGPVTPLPRTLELDLGDGLKLKAVRMEPGKFAMGSPPDERGRRADEAQHEVEITKPFAMGVYTVTQAQYRRIMGTNPSWFSPKGEGRNSVGGLNADELPVENVNWEEALEFCRIVSLLPGVKEKGWVVDLPTEAEWEYAARAGTRTAFHYGNSLSSEQANFDGQYPYGGAAKGRSLGRTTTVGSYAPNAWGLYDMHGNVMQWTKDPYGPNRTTRGGFYNMAAGDLRAARRLPQDPWARGSPLGFRVVVRMREKSPG